MKKIIGIIFISLMFANIAFAKMTLIEEAKVGDYSITTVCIDRYRYVIVDRMHKDGGASVVQSMAMDRNYGVTITWRCKN